MGSFNLLRFYSMKRHIFFILETLTTDSKLDRSIHRLKLQKFIFYLREAAFAIASLILPTK